MPLFATVILISAPFLLGLNRPLGWTALGVLLLLAILIEPRRLVLSGAFTHAMPMRVALLLAALFAFALPLLQLASGVCTELPASRACVSNPEQSWLSLALMLTLALWFLLLCGSSRPATDRLLMALGLAGILQAAYALLMFALGYTPLFLGNVFHHENVPTGGFANRNHLAAFLNVTIFATIALVLRLPADTGGGRAGRWRLLLDQRLLWRLGVVLMVLALIATRSRAGNAAFLIGLLSGFVWLLLVERRRLAAWGKSLRWRFVALVIVSVLALDTLLIGSFVGIDKVQQRIADTSLESEQRDSVNATLLAHPALFTAFGHGAGSFLPAFERIKPADLPLLYSQAHNDYLQVLVERGWVGAGLFAGALTLVLWQALGPAAGRRGAEVRFALVAASTALLVHALVEYVTQVPAIWLAWLALLSLALRRSATRRRQRANS